MLNVLNVDYLDYSKEGELFCAFYITRASASPLIHSSTLIIFSVAYETREKFYALCPVGTSVDIVHQVFPKTHYIVHSVSFDEIPLRFHLTLLINRLAMFILILIHRQYYLFFHVMTHTVRT